MQTVDRTEILREIPKQLTAENFAQYLLSDTALEGTSRELYQIAQSAKGSRTMGDRTLFKPFQKQLYYKRSEAAVDHICRTLKEAGVFKYYNDDFVHQVSIALGKSSSLER